jgi:drug/metabolite transporter (DMT)-like permease
VTFAALILFYALMSEFGLYNLKAGSVWLGWEFLLGFVMNGRGFIAWLYILRNFPIDCASCCCMQFSCNHASLGLLVVK